MENLTNNPQVAVLISIITGLLAITAAGIAGWYSIQSARRQPSTKDALDQSQTIETQARTIERLSKQFDELQKEVSQIKKGRKIIGNFSIDPSDTPSATINVQYENVE